jgi:hypothetical protein
MFFRLESVGLPSGRKHSPRCSLPILQSPGDWIDWGLAAASTKTGALAPRRFRQESTRMAAMDTSDFPPAFRPRGVDRHAARSCQTS